MRKIFLLAILIYSIQLSFAQSQTIENEISNSSETKSVLISKGRALLLDKFLIGDTTKVREIEDYLNKQSNDDYVSLYIIEQWYLDYWTKNFNHLIQTSMRYDSISSSVQNKIRPSEDYLYFKLQQKLYLQKQTIVNSIKESDLTQSDKDFLVMHLFNCLITKDTKDITQDTLNILADDYIKKYPNNEHIGIIRKYICYKLIPSDWGYAMEFFSGYGVFSGNLKNHYSNNVPMGIAFDIYYKNLVLYLRDYIGFSSTKHDFTAYGEQWPENSQVRVFLPEASLGYVIHDSKHLKLAPFIGLSSTDIGPTDYDLTKAPNLKNYELKFSTTYSIGFNMDIKFGKPKMAMVSNDLEESYWFLRIRYGYNFPQFSKSYNGFDGNMQYITIGLGGFGRKLKRSN